MDTERILAACDHTLLLQTATLDEIKALCDDALKYKTASVCIPPCYVKQAKEYISGALGAMLDLGAGSGPMDHGFDINSRFSK